MFMQPRYIKFCDDVGKRKKRLVRAAAEDGAEVGGGGADVLAGVELGEPV